MEWSTTCISFMSSAPPALTQLDDGTPSYFLHELLSANDSVQDTNATLLSRFSNEQAKTWMYVLPVKLVDDEKPVPTVDEYDGLLVWYCSVPTRIWSNFYQQQARLSLIMVSSCNNTRVLIQTAHCYRRVIWCTKVPRWKGNGWVYWSWSDV